MTLLGRTARHPTLRRVVRAIVYRLAPRARARRDAVESAYVSGHWEAAAALAKAAVERNPLLAGPGVYRRQGLALARLERHDKAAKALERGLSRNPTNLRLASAAAELEMYRGRYRKALKSWDAVVALAERDTAAPRRPGWTALPTHGRDFEWSEPAWTALAGVWLQGKPEKLPARTWVALTDVLRAIGENDVALRVCRRALKAYPDDVGVAQHACELVMARHPGKVAQLPTLITSVTSSPQAQAIATAIAAAAAVVARWGDDPSVPGEVRLLTVERGSALESAVRAADYWDEGRVASEADRLARRDAWPEAYARTDRLSRAAWVDARRWARGRGERYGLPDSALAQALFHLIKHEFVMRIPPARVAAEIARTHHGGPVLVELSSRRLDYLAGYPSSGMTCLYLYDELRRLGVSAYLVKTQARERGRGLGWVRRRLRPQPRGLTLKPRVMNLRPTVRERSRIDGAARDLVVPSGIRSTAAVVSAVPHTLVLQSGAALKQFSYDQSFDQWWNYPAHASVHPSGALLPTLTIPTTPVRRWVRVGTDLVAEPATGRNRGEATLEHGTWMDPDWHELLESLLGPYFLGLVERARELIAQQGITDVHIADYLYAEPSLVAACVVQAGGRVHVWPHSTNPVHVAYREPDTIASVRAVTRAGAEVWREHLEVPVSLVPEVMLPHPRAEFGWNPDEALHVVVIGGRPAMRHLPLVDLDVHEQTYRRFFEGLAPLVAEGRVRVLFKPRGNTGETEQWLDGVVGRAADWESVLEHPMRMSMPNPVFVSISVGSSALLEGCGRGIPGMVVSEGAARPYLATDADLVETHAADSAVARVAQLARRDGWEAMREHQMHVLRRDFEEAARVQRV